MSKSFRTFLSRPRNVVDRIRKGFEQKTPFEKVELVRKPVSLILEIIGINVLSDCKRNWRTPICAVTALQVSCLLFYTMQFYWAENKITALQPFAISAMAISVNIQHVDQPSFVNDFLFFFLILRSNAWQRVWVCTGKQLGPIDIDTRHSYCSLTRTSIAIVILQQIMSAYVINMR